MAADRSTAHRFLAFAGLILAALLFLPPLVEHARLSANACVMNDDARQWVAPFGGGALESDPVSAYFRALTPSGYRLLYRAAGALSLHRPLSKVLPYALLAAVCAFAALTTASLAGRTAGVVSIAFVLATSGAMSRLTGGTPRAFAFPIVAAAAWGLVSHRPRVAAAATLAGAAFYPPAAMIAGAAFALSLALPGPAEDRRKTAALVAVSAVLSLVLLAPLMLAQRSYGRRLTPSDIAAFPEAGPQGRYFPGDRPPFASTIRAAYEAVDRGLSGNGRPLLPPPAHARRAARAAIIGLSALVLLVSAWKSDAIRRLLLVPAVSVALYALALALQPYLFTPDRYVAYSLTLFPAIGIPVAATELAKRLRAPRAGIPVALVLLLFTGGRGSAHEGLTVDDRTFAPLYARIAAMPEAKLVAGWPGGPIESLPALTGKPAFLTFETHAAFHEGMTLEMRRRMRALTAACFAASPQPLVDLRERWGVTHLLVDRAHFAGKPPSYFAPFTDEVRDAETALRGRTPEVLRQEGPAAVVREGRFLLLDLRRLEIAPGQP